ncbi:MAG: hypothetical protein WC337_11060, partial [Candidatus Muiribacteriota bacterium]
MSLKKICFLYIILFSAFSIFATQPAPGIYPGQNISHTNIRINQSSPMYSPAYSSGNNFFLAPNPVGTNRLLVIRVEAPDKPMTLSLAGAQTFYQDVTAFYTENSYGQCTVTPTFTTNVYTLPCNL